MPVDNFYEWKKVDGGKQPYAIGLKGGGVMALAGLGGPVATEPKVRIQPSSSPASVGSRRGRSSPRATVSGNVKAYRPSMLMWSNPSGERRLMSSSRTSKPPVRS